MIGVLKLTELEWMTDEEETPCDVGDQDLLQREGALVECITATELAELTIPHTSARKERITISLLNTDDLSVCITMGETRRVAIRRSDYVRPAVPMLTLKRNLPLLPYCPSWIRYVYQQFTPYISQPKQAYLDPRISAGAFEIRQKSWNDHEGKAEDSPTGHSY